MSGMVRLGNTNDRRLTGGTRWAYGNQTVADNDSPAGGMKATSQWLLCWPRAAKEPFASKARPADNVSLFLDIPNASFSTLIQTRHGMDILSSVATRKSVTRQSAHRRPPAFAPPARGCLQHAALARGPARGLERDVTITTWVGIAPACGDVNTWPADSVATRHQDATSVCISRSMRYARRSKGLRRSEASPLPYGFSRAGLALHYSSDVYTRRPNRSTAVEYTATRRQSSRNVNCR
jgi:hypothetical protein